MKSQDGKNGEKTHRTNPVAAVSASTPHTPGVSSLLPLSNQARSSCSSATRAVGRQGGGPAPATREPGINAAFGGGGGVDVRVACVPSLAGADGLPMGGYGTG